MKRTFWSFALLLLITSPLAGEETPDVSPAISQPGELLFSSDFDGDTIPSEWVPLHGTQWSIVDGALQGQPSTREFQERRIADGNKSHSGGTPSSRLMVEVDDCIMLLRFKYSDGLKGAHFGFNDGSFATGTGHVCRFITSVTELALQADQNAKVDDDADEIIATSEFTIEPDTWYWMMLEVVGDQFAAQISGSPMLKARHPRVDTPKDQINLPTRGGGSIYYDHVRVWNAEPIN
tara:strand:+ start:4174 stop:4878 length:705 start_codon:yes stop_codon:yes gene_type:complete